MVDPVLVLALLGAAAEIPAGPPIRIASICTTHYAPADEFKIENAVDGDPETKWVGEGHPLTVQPTNIVIRLPRPVTVGRLVLVSQMHRDVLALKDLDVYAWAKGSWGGSKPLASLRGIRDVRSSIDLLPATTDRLRIRILDTWRDDNAYPRLVEIEVFEAPPGASPAALEDGPVPREGKSERLLLARAMGERIEFPGEPFDPGKGYLHYARAFLDSMIAEGTDVYGPRRSPMFASLIDLELRRTPEDIPACVPGQRYGDRSVRGGNLFHDVMLLRACDLVSDLTGDRKYREAAAAYLKFFCDNCRQPTGLFPWGEHAHWDFRREAPGDDVHEYLGGVPGAFWERLWALSPETVRGQGDGLLNHVVNLGTFDFDRHAGIRTPLPDPRAPGRGFLDFPRHAGFYINLWAFLGARTGEARYLEWARKMIEREDRRRDPKAGLPPSSVRDPVISTETMLSFSVSLLEAARFLPAGPLGESCEASARTSLDAILRLPHRPAEGKFLTSFPVGGDPARDGTFGEPYRYGYGGGFSADDAILLLAAHRLTGDRRPLDLALGFAGFYARCDPPPPTDIVRAHVYASILGLFADLHDLLGRPEHLEGAERHARLAIGRLFWKGLFRGATGIDHYEGDLGVGNLVYDLVWLHALRERGPGKSGIEPNYFNR